MKEKISKLPYSSIPFSVVLSLVTFVQGLIIFLNADEWDYGQHTNVIRYVIDHELAFDEFRHAKQALAYPLYHYLVKIIHLLAKIDYPFSIALLMIMCNIASIICFRKLIKLFTNDADSYLLDFLSIFSVVFIAARGPLTHWRYYIVMTGPNPIHNPTLIMVRPLGVLCFYYFCKFFTGYKSDRKGNNWDLVGFGIFSLLSVLAKPSFAVVYLAAMGLYTLIVMIKNKDLFVGIRTFIAVLPSVITLLLQQRFITANSSMLGIEVHFGSFMDLGILDVIMITVAFMPSALLLINFEKLKNDVYYQIAYLATLIGWLQFYFLDNGNSGDFSWGYALSLQIITVVSLSQAYKDHDCYKYGKIRLTVAWMAFIYQALMGVLYLYKVYKFGDYWI